MDLTEKLIKDGLFLWSTIDPIGSLALFASMTAHYSIEKRKSIALRAIVYSGIVLIVAIVIGQLLLTYMGIQLISLRLSGGIILFLFGLQMIFSSNSSDNAPNKEPDHDIAVFPLAIPSIASPGSLMAVIILTDNNVYEVSTQIYSGLVLILILAITYLFMRLAGTIMKTIGKNGAAVLVKIMGMILAALSIEIIMNVLRIPEWIKENPIP